MLCVCLPWPGGSFGRELDTLPEVVVLKEADTLPSSSQAVTMNIISSSRGTDLLLPASSSRRPSPFALNAQSSDFSFTRILAREIVWDLAALVLLLVVLLGMEHVSPRAAYINKATLYEHAYPYKTNTVPSWSVSAPTAPQA